MFGSCFKMRLKAREKEAVSVPTSRWPLMHLSSRCKILSGLSRVTMCLVLSRLIRWSIDASEVNLPLLVVPVTGLCPSCPCQPPYHLRQVQILKPRHPKRDETHDDGDRASLAKRVHPETVHPYDRIGEGQLAFLLECLSTFSDMVSLIMYSVSAGRRTS